MSLGKSRKITKGNETPSDIKPKSQPNKEISKGKNKPDKSQNE